MARKKTKKRRPPERRPKAPEKCLFCVAKKEPDYKDYQTLEKFLTDRAKIIGKRRSGICSQHQRRLSVAIKRARHLGLLPFRPNL